MKTIQNKKNQLDKQSGKKCIPLHTVKGNHPSDRSLVTQLFRSTEILFNNNSIESEGTNSHPNPQQNEQINQISSLPHFRLLCSQTSVI